MNFLKNIINKFKKKPKQYKVPMYEKDGETFSGWFMECTEGDDSYKAHMKVYGKIPDKIILD